MKRTVRFVTGFVLACAGLSASLPAGFAEQAPAAATPPDETREEIARIRSELEGLRREYGDRMAGLEARLAAIESPPTQAPAASAEGAAGTPPPYTTAAAGSKVFNPDIAVIGDFLGAVGKTPGSGEASLELRESELSFQAVVDPYARADFFFTFGPEGAGVEEGYLTFPTLPGGLLMRVGRMRDAFGKVDAAHTHVLPYVDRPLMTQNLLGGEDALSDDGISLARLVPNPWLFLEATGQVFRGDSAVFKAPARGDLAYVGHLRAYRDLSESANLDLGGSIAYGHNGIGQETTTRLLGLDLTLRYRPLRRSIYTHFLARGELAWSRRQDLQGSPTAVGGYGYLEYQFARRWSAGLRFDDAARAAAPGLHDRGASFVLSYWPSEFSQLRGQYRHTRFGEGRSVNELLFQFVYAIGAHGAHPF